MRSVAIILLAAAGCAVATGQVAKGQVATGQDPSARAERADSCAGIANLKIDGVEITKAATIPETPTFAIFTSAPISVWLRLQGT